MKEKESFFCPNLNYCWAGLIVEELIRLGVDYFCLAPGSRCAPLALSVGYNPLAKRFVHIDERGLAFHALGYTSAFRRPSVLISTSGTAAANFLPAIIEASKRKLPLIVLTADRPPELRLTGADQTIEQTKLFSEFVRFFFDLPCPDLNISPSFILTTVDQAVFRAKSYWPGPVHLNCMFREPLSPIKTKDDFAQYLQPIKTWIKATNPLTTYVEPTRGFLKEDLLSIQQIFNKESRGVIAVGKLAGKEDQDAVLKLSQTLQWPIFADISSGLRLGCKEGNVIHYYDQLLLSNRLKKLLRFQTVLHLGGRLTSKRFERFVGEYKPEHYVMVLNHPLRHDPLHQVSHRVVSKVADFCQALMSSLKPSKDFKTLTMLTKLNLAVDQKLKYLFSQDDRLTEPKVARLISQSMAEHQGLFLSNSLPIRHLDMFADPSSSSVTIGANRGASGIDGIIASSVGFAVGLKKIVTLLIGDLAFLHDLNSLAMLKDKNVKLIIIVLNNNGGGIFSLLPIAEASLYFEEFFGTPHHLEFKKTAEQFSIHYFKPATTDEFSRDYQKALSLQTSSLLEVVTNRDDNVNDLKAIQNKIVSVIDQNLLTTVQRSVKALKVRDGYKQSK